jgi:hypothetical protein
MRFTPSYYLQRAAELETSAAEASDSAARKHYQDLAQAFRDVANSAAVSKLQSDDEVMRMAERMVGKTSNAH